MIAADSVRMTEGQTVVMAVYQPGVVTGAPGAPRVNTSGRRL
ncbi:MAG: hypothetical protein WC563_07420 [Brevundimonas sp.]